MIFSSMSGYDPDEPEGKTSSQYMSMKDLKWILIILVVLVIIFIPVFENMKKESEKARCAQNMQGMFSAMGLYGEIHDGHFPPTYVVGDNGSPMISNGVPNTWATLLQPSMSSRVNFKCPTAKPDEIVRVENPQGSDKVIELTYGMYIALSGKYISDLQNPSRTVVIAETSNMGAQGTYDPLPFKTSAGEIVPFDGFAIGYNDDNFVHSEVTNMVTRLAFYNTSTGEKGLEGPKVLPRHNKNILALFADGTLGKISPNQARVRHLTPGLIGTWETPRK